MEKPHRGGGVFNKRGIVYFFLDVAHISKIGLP